MSRKVFTAGEVLAAADVNTYLMDQAVMSFAGTASRGSAIPTPVEGMTTYLEDTDVLQIWNGSIWKAVTGGILQVVSTAKTDTFVSSSLSAGSQVAVTGLSATITPSSTANKILVQASVYVDSAGDNMSAILMRAGTAVAGATGDAAGSRTRVTSSSSKAGAAALMTTLPMIYLDSPATTSATTYSVNILNNNSASAVLYVNRSATDSNLAQFSRGMSSITLTEVAG